MGEVQTDDVPFSVLGYVDKEHPFHATVDAAVEKGLRERWRSDQHREKQDADIRVRTFAGRVANDTTFETVSNVQGVTLERELIVEIA